MVTAPTCNIKADGPAEMYDLKRGMYKRMHANFNELKQHCKDNCAEIALQPSERLIKKKSYRTKFKILKF